MFTALPEALAILARDDGDGAVSYAEAAGKKGWPPQKIYMGTSFSLTAKSKTNTAVCIRIELRFTIALLSFKC